MPDTDLKDVGRSISQLLKAPQGASSAFILDEDRAEIGKEISKQLFGPTEEPPPLLRQPSLKPHQPPEQKESLRGVFAETASAIGAGLDQIGEAMAGTAEMVGIPGAGRVREYYSERAKMPERARPEYLQNETVLEHPERLADWRWWVRSLGENLPSMVAMYAPGVLAIKGAQALDWGVKATRAAGLSGAFTGAFSIESGSAYSQAKKEMAETGQFDPQTIEYIATKEGLVAGTANSIIELLPFDNLFLRQAGIDRLVKRIVRQSVLEGATEAAQEAVNVLAEKLGHKPEQKWSGQIGRILEAGIVGGAMGGIAGGVVGNRTLGEKVSAGKAGALRVLGIKPRSPSATPVPDAAPMATSAVETKTGVTEPQRQAAMDEEHTEKIRAAGAALYEAVLNEDLAEEAQLETARLEAEKAASLTDVTIEGDPAITPSPGPLPNTTSLGLEPNQEPGPEPPESAAPGASFPEEPLPGPQGPGPVAGTTDRRPVETQYAPEDNVFARMPDDVLKQQADYGVQGAKDELARRETGTISGQATAQKEMPAMPPPVAPAEALGSETVNVSPEGENAQSETKEAVGPTVGSVVSWTTGRGNSLSGTITKLDGGRVTVKTDAGKIYSLNPAKAKGFTITDQKGETTNGKEESTATAGTEIPDGAEPGRNAAPDLKIAGTKGKRGPTEVKPLPQSRSFTERMKNAETADEGRRLISEYQEAFASIEKAAGLQHTVGMGGSGFGSRAYSTLTAKEKKAIIKRVSAKNAELGKQLSDLINDIDESEPHWETLLAKERAHFSKSEEEDQEDPDGLHLMDGTTRPNRHGVYDKKRGTEAIAYEGKKASATIYVAQLQNGKWISAYAEEHKQGSRASGSSPLMADEQFDTREEAVAARARRIAEHEKRTAADSSSVVTPQQRAEAAKMAEWAEGLIGQPEVKEEPAEITAAGPGGKRGPKEKAKVKQENPAKEEPKAGSIDDEIQNASMEDIDALIDAVIAEQEGTRQSGKDAVPIAELTPERQAASAIKDMQDNPPTAWVVSNDQVTSSEQEIEEVSKLLGRALNGNEKYTITHRSDRNFDLLISIDNEDGMGHDFLDLVRVSPAFAKIIRDMAADALVVRFGIIRTEPEKIVPVKEITDTKKKYAALDAFTSKDESRLSFQGFLNDEGTLVATNGHIMAVVPRAGKDLEVGKIYRMKKGGGLEVIRDQFPDYKRAIPELADVNNFATLSREQAEYLLSLLGATEERNRVNRSDVKGEFVSLMLFTVNLPDFSLVNGEYLATCLRLGLSMGADEVSFYRKPGVNRLRHPVLMVASKGGDAVAKMVIMPLREETAGLDISLSDIATRKKEASAPSKTMSPTSPKVAAPSRSLDSILADATKEGFGGAAEAIKGLYELFGGGSLKSFPGGFDADTYTKAKPHFEAAMEHMRNAGKGLKEFVSFFVERLGATVKPYLVRYLQDLKGVEPAAEASATTGAENSTSDAETKKEDAEDAINLDENTGKGEKGSRKRLTAEEKSEREAKKQAAKEKKEKKAALGNFQNVGYVYDPEKINRKIKDKPPKSAAKILLDEMAPAKVWNIQFAENATPGTTRMLDQVQKYFVSFKDFLTNDYNKIKRYAFKRKAEDAVNLWLEEGPGNIDQLKAWAEEYGKALQPVIDAFQGQSGIMRTIHRLQTELLGDVRRNEDGTFPEYHEIRSSLSHHSLNRDLFTANGVSVRYFYSFLAEDYQRLLDAENDILLSEININKRTRNQTVVRIGLPDYRESVDLQKTEDFQGSFGFNGVGFGEQGWINQEERHRVVNAAYDAFKDLAATIGATEKGMSLGGGLAVQFANLGHKAKGAAAAYFPDIKTINFTRDHGDGTMAHEWGHALHYMAAPETIEEINSVIQTMKFVYDFEAGTRMVDDLLAKDSPFLKRILSSKRQQRIEAVKAEADRRFVSVVKKETDYFSTAKEMDADYTARETEMWARAFEAYIYDTMAGTNNYLVNDFVSAGRVGGRSGVGTRLVYPAGLERETFNATIKHFLEGLAWDENGLPHLKEGYETIEQLNERLLDEKLKELQDSVEERYKAIWSSEPSADGYYWYQYDETAFGPMMQPDGYAAYDKGYQGPGQNGSGAVGYLTQLHPDAILDYKLSNIRYEGENSTYISDARGGIHDTLQEDGTEVLEGELPQRGSKDDSPGDVRSTERGSGGDGERGSVSVSRERGAGGRSEGDGDSGVHLSTAPGNYRITDPTLTDPKPVTERFNRNLAAIKVLKSIESEDRSASPGVTFIGEEPPGGWTEADKVSHKYDTLAERGNEKEILARYTGWGGMAELFAWEPGKAWAGKAELLKAELDRNEIRGAESSSTSSYYTPVPVAQFMWKLAQRLGFERGVVLDPATGASGLFFGTMPGELQQNVALQGVEMDGISARIASKLYELAAIDNKPFQEVKKPNNRYDLTITNVPFEGITPSDPKHNKGQYLLHNYFINKMLDLTAPGALSMMITTSNTMDKAGAHLQEFAKKADFVGAIRLPSGIYSATNVVTDILVFRKKIEGSKFQGIPAEEWTTTGTHESTGLEVNDYFLKHPEMIAGKLEVIQGRWGDDNIRVVGEGDLQTNLERLAAAFPAKIVEREAVRELKSIDDIIAAPGTVKEGGLYINDKGEACLKVEGEEEKLPTATASEKKRAGIAKAFVKILDQVRTVLRAQKTGAAEAEIKAAQKQLKKEYDDFVKKYGPVNSPDNTKIYGEATDADWVVALEDYDLDTGKVVKLADIFTKDITISGQTPTRADTDHDALAMSLNEFGYPNLEYMAKLRGSDVETVMKGVSDKIVEDPETGFLVTMDEYLSGNVKRKLLVAREMAESNPEYERNVKLLEAAQPDEIPAHRITARIGASWIDPQHLSDYVTEKLDMDGILTPVFSFNPITNEWALSFKGRPRYKGKNWGEESKAETERQIQRFRSSVEATRLWGTNRRDFIALIQDAIAGKRPEVHYAGADGKRYLDEVATQAAENKLQEIQSDFGRWLFDEPGRAEAAVNRFNDLINTSIPPKADGSHLTFPGKSLAVLTQKEKEDLRMTDAIAFYPHQSNAVWKYLRGGNIYLAHEVGAGKTMTMALLAMEAKRLRGKKKVLYVTLNDSTMGQAVAEIKKLYPLANVLQVRVSTQEQRKRRALQKLAMNDFDIAIMRQQDLDRIALSPEAETVFIEEELQEYREVLEEAKRSGSRIQEQQIQQAIHALEEKLKAPGVHDEAKRKNLFFDDLGIDLMIVDEAHRYKNVPYATRLNRITGLNPAGSPTAKAFFRKTQYMNAQYPRQDGVVLASGTALSNSIAEFYNIQRMLQPKEVKRQGVWSFDRWIANYGDMGSQLEWDGARGRYKNITTNRKIVNAGRLLATAYQNIDCVRAEDTPIRRPKIRGGEPQRIKIQPNQYVEDYRQIVLQRCAEIEQNPKEAMFEGVPDNMLRVISNMSKIAIDQRLDPRYKNTELQEDSKIYRASRLIRRRWEEEAEHKGVQVVFADIGIPKRYLNFKYKTDEELEKLTDEQREEYAVKKVQYEASANQFSTYDGLKDELIKLGIPAEQIAFIHDADDTNKDKKAAKLRKLFKKVNEGEIRVLIGSTDKAGTGVNIQKRISDVHHLDVWWNYSSWEQRNGRAIRAGNIYTDMEGVYIHNYVTETTVDATRWDKIFAKGKVLNATLGGDINLDVIEDISEETMSAKMMAAEASGNPLMAKQATLLQQVQGLRFEQSSFLDNVRRARMDLAATPDRIAAQEKYIEDYKASRATMEKVTAVRFAGDNHTLILEKHGKEIAETLKKAIGKDLTAWDPGKTAPLLVFGTYTATEKTIEENGKSKNVKEYSFIPLTAKAEMTGVEGDPFARGLLMSGGIMNAERTLAEIKGKGKNATVDVKANISRTVTEYLTRLDSLEKRANDSIKALREDEPKFRKIAETPWSKAGELEEKAKELAEVEREMAAQGQPAGNPETGVPINLFKGTVPVLEDIAAKSDWNITKEGVVYPDGYDPAIAIRKQEDLNKFSETKTRFKPSFAGWNSPDQVSAVLVDATKPETPAMKPIAYTTVDDATRFWMNDKFKIHGNEAVLTVDAVPWRFLERVVGTAGTWHPEEFRGSFFLVHVGIDGQRDAMIAARAERGEVPAGVAELMDQSSVQQYSAVAGDNVPSRPYRLGDIPLASMVNSLVGIIKGVSVEERNGQIWLRTTSGKEVQVVAAERIAADEAALTIGYRESASGRRIAGLYRAGRQPGSGSRTIFLARDVAGVWTLSHEFYHFLEDIGAISGSDKRLLNNKISSLIATDPRAYGFLAGRSKAEARAEWVGRTLAGIYDSRTVTGRIVKRVGDIIDVILNALGIRTAKAVIRDIETGMIYGNEVPQGGKGTDAQFSIAEDFVSGQIDKAGQKIDRAVATIVGRPDAKRVEDYVRFKEHWREFWSPFSTVKNSKRLLAARYRAMGNAAKAVRFLEGMQTQLAAFPDDVKKDIFWYLNGDIPLSAISPAAQPIARSLRRRTEIIGEMLVDRGIISRETFKSHQGQYVHYLYAKHILGDNAPVGVTSSGKLDLSYTKRRNPNLTLQQRKELGLIDDASIAVPVGMGKALTDIAKYDYLETIARNDEWVWQPSIVRLPIGRPLAKPVQGRTRRNVTMGIGKLAETVKIYNEMMRVRPSAEVAEIHQIVTSALERATESTGNVPADFVQLPNAKGYGPLAGAYVKVPIADDLRPVLDIAADGGKLLGTLVSIERQGMAAFKMGKVALNLPTAFRNIVSNIIQNNMRGRPLAKIPGDIIAALESMKKKDAYYEEAFGMGLFHTNWFVTEINDVLREFRKAETGRIDKVLVALGNVAKYYGKIDDVNKFAIFVQMREDGASIDEAALEAMKWGMDYSLTSRSIKGLRQTVMPFATYQYKITPLIFESLRKRPWVLAKYALIYPAAKMIAMAAHDLDDDDWDDLVKQLPAYIKKSGSMMILPWKSNKGQWQWVNLEYYFPWGNWLAMFRDLKEADSGEFLRDLGISNPFLSMFVTGVTARDDQPPIHAYFGTPIYNELDPAPVKMAKYLEYMANTWMPSMVTRQGALGYTGKMLMGSEDRYGRSVSFGQAIGRWFGLNIVAVSPEQTRAQVSVQIQNLRKELARVESDPSYSEKEKAAYRTRFDRALAEIATKAPSAVLPITKVKGTDPVYEALLAMAQKGTLHTGPPSRSMELRGVPVKMTMAQYGEYLELSSEISRRKLGVLVESPAWERMPDARKGDVVAAIVANARKAARQKIKAQMLTGDRLRKSP